MKKLLIAIIAMGLLAPAAFASTKHHQAHLVRAKHKHHHHKRHKHKRVGHSA